MIRLESINNKNAWDVIDLKVKKSQRDFVASNLFSIAQAYTTLGTECSAFPFAIMKGKKAVGFLMIGYNEAALYEDFDEVVSPEALKNNYSLWRLMIDKKYQKKGYGRKAIKLALDFVRSFPCGEAEYCEVSYEPENKVAAKLYRSLGFVENGEMDGDEIVAVLKL